MSYRKPSQFNIPEILRNDYVFVTKAALEEFEMVLDGRQDNYYRNRKVSSAARIEEIKYKRKDKAVANIIEPILNEEHLEGFNDELPIQLQSETLRRYIDDLRRI